MNPERPEPHEVKDERQFTEQPERFDCPGNCDEGRIYNNGDESAQYVCCDYCNGKGYLNEKEFEFYTQWLNRTNENYIKNKKRK